MHLIVVQMHYRQRLRGVYVLPDEYKLLAPPVRRQRADKLVAGEGQVVLEEREGGWIDTW